MTDPLRDAILELLDQRAAGATICPSEAARRVAGDGDFRALMDDSRRAAAELVAEGRIEVTQKGEPVDLATARGPIRLRLRAPAADADTPAEDTPAEDTPAEDTPADDTPADDASADDTDDTHHGN